MQRLYSVIVSVSLIRLMHHQSNFYRVQQAKEMVLELIREQGFREQRGEYGSRVGGGGGGGGGGGDGLDVSTEFSTVQF